MKFIDLKAQQKEVYESIRKNIDKVLKHGEFILGPEVLEIEDRLAKYVGVKKAISCSSGTDALLITLLAYGIKSGDYIITTPFTFIGSFMGAALLGIKPIFVDIHKDTYNISPENIENILKNPIDPISKKQIDRNNIKAIIAVDLFGLIADYEKINKIAANYKIKVIEDAAQAIGASYKDENACSFGDIACLSFFPEKTLGCYGDGGMIFTNDDDISERVKSIRQYGMGQTKYESLRLGLNGRLDTLQASILLAKLEIFEEELKKRELIANTYNNALESKYYTQRVNKYNKSAWSQYSLRSKEDSGINRDLVIKALKAKNIPYATYYAIPLHLQKAFKHFGYKIGSLPISEEYSKTIFQLPFHPYLKAEEQDLIIQTLLEI